MTATVPTPQELQNIRDLAFQWGKIVARRAFGEAGPPLDCHALTLEQLAQTAAQGLLEGTLTTLLEQQAQAVPQTQPCPTCQQPCPVHRETRPLEGLGGIFTYPEPVAHCSACRRDFFPSAAQPGPG